MASSGTVSLSIDFRHKPDPTRESVMLAGKSQIKNTAVVEAGDLTLRTIKAFVATPYFVRDPAGGTYVGEETTLYGSINTSGSLMNSVTIRSLKGTENPLAPGSGTRHLGTVPGGTIQLNYLAIGA